MVCTLTEKNGETNWCERHRAFHRGHLADYATEDSERGERFRKLWDKMANGDHKPPKPRREVVKERTARLRPIDDVHRCRFLGARLTMEEGRQHEATLLQLGVKCNTCSGKRNEFHCEKRQFTNMGFCMGKCTEWEPVSIINAHKATTIGLLGTCETSPKQLALLLTFGEAEVEISLPQKVNMPTMQLWHGKQDHHWASVSTFNQDGPNMRYRLTIEHDGITLHAGLLTLIDCAPFLAICAGDVDGKPWAATVVEEL